MRTLPVFDDDALCCPHCGFNYTHHHKVEIFERPEDADTGLHVTVREQKIAVDDSMQNCPSNRRHGVRIYFNCEGCEAESELTIVQHKGNTYVNTRMLYLREDAALEG